MRIRLRAPASWCAVLLVAFALTLPVHADGDGAASARPLLWQPSMNVFRRYAAETDDMFRFYGGALGLEQLETYNVGNATDVARFRVGTSEVKLTKRVADRDYVPGGPRDATGLRLLTFFYPDRDAVVERFREHGYIAPEFRELPGGERWAAVVTDPDGHAVELVIAPDAAARLYDSIEVGLTVGDVERSRAFYREFVGLEELP